MILVTGAAGTIGQEVVKALTERGVRFRAGHRRRPVQVPSSSESVEVDFTRPQTLGPALRGVETVFLLSNDVASEANLVKAAAAAGVRRLVKLSVMGAPEERFTFARWHRASEQAIEASGMAWTFLRPNGFMQNVVNFMGQTIRGQKTIFTSAPDAPISHVHARDVGAVAAKALTEDGHEGRAYELTGPAAITYRDVARTLTTVLGHEIKVVPISDEDYKKGAVGAGMPEAYADALVDLNRAYREGLAARVSPAVQQLLGRPAISFETFARENAAALR